MAEGLASQVRRISRKGRCVKMLSGYWQVCRSSRDAEDRMVGMLTSGKVPLEKTLMEKAEVSNGYRVRHRRLRARLRRSDLH